jgi:hypothetical protein
MPGSRAAAQSLDSVPVHRGAVPRPVQLTPGLVSWERSCNGWPSQMLWDRFADDGALALAGSARPTRSGISPSVTRNSSLARLQTARVLGTPSLACRCRGVGLASSTARPATAGTHSVTTLAMSHHFSSCSSDHDSGHTSAPSPSGTCQHHGASLPNICFLNLHWLLG